MKSAMFLLCLCEGIAYSQSCILLETLKLTLFQLTYTGASRAHQEWLQHGCLLEDLEWQWCYQRTNAKLWSSYCVRTQFEGWSERWAYPWFDKLLANLEGGYYHPYSFMSSCNFFQILNLFGRPNWILVDHVQRFKQNLHRFSGTGWRCILLSSQTKNH